MYLLGISCWYHDSAAVLLKDGEIISAVQEERFSRIKHDSSFPKNAIKYCLKESGISLIDISKIIFYDDPDLKFKRIKKTYLTFFPRSISFFFRSYPIWYFKKRNWKKLLKREFNFFFDTNINEDNILKSLHHK